MSGKKVKILMVLDNTGRGGSQSFVMNVIRNIDKEKFQFDIAITRNKLGGFDEEMEALGCKIYNLEHFEVTNYRRFVNCWENFLTEHHFDIIHGHVSSTASIYLRVARMHGCSTIVHSHSAGYRGGWFEQQVKKLFTIRAAKYADLWFACSDKAAERLFGKKFKESSRYHYIPNAIDVKKYLFNEEVRNMVRIKIGVEQDKFICGHVGTFSTPKNHKFLLQVFKKIKEKRSDSKLLLVGDGYLHDTVVQMIEENGLKDDVIMTGSVSDVNNYLMAMDVLVFPSLFEGLPVTVVEAQAAGLPVVVSDVITRDVFLTDLVTYKPLSDSAEDWSVVVLGKRCKERKVYNERVASTVFNMRTSVKQLGELYLGLVKNRKLKI